MQNKQVEQDDAKPKIGDSSEKGEISDEVVETEESIIKVDLVEIDSNETQKNEAVHENEGDLNETPVERIYNPNNLDDDQKIALLEGLLFIVGDDGIDLYKINNVMELEVQECDMLISKLNESYLNDPKRGLTISSFNGKFRLTTKKEYYNSYVKLFDQKTEVRLSQAALETLAIIAYRGPIARHAVEEIRGVNCENVMYKLRQRDLIEDAGKSDEPGKPTMYRVTEEFMKVFNLNSLEDLPKINVSEAKSGEDLFK